MPLYEYKGVAESGKSSKGVIEADSIKTARAKLKQKGVYPTEIRERSAEAQKEKKKVLSIGGGVKLKNLTLMIRQLATLIKARIPLDEALLALIEQTDDPKLKSVMSQIKESVNEGKSLAASCRIFPQVFNPTFCAMIQVGEASGTLDLVLNRLATFSEAQYELRNKVLGSMAYPAFMMVAGLGITIFLFAFAVPKITEVFAGSKMALPTLTLVMITISEFMSKQWMTIIVVLVGSFFFFKWYTSTVKGREWWDRISLRIPIYGKLKRMVAVSRFARTLSTLIGSGIQLLEAIDIVKDVVDNAIIKKALTQSRESIAEGHTIAGPLKASGEFPPILTHMIAVGEKTGELEEMLNVVSDAYDTQVDTAIKSMTRLLEPLMILLMGGMIALVALSIFLPMLQLNNLTGLPG
ncbi:MAG: type II secretion system inner membrane protein GspF [Deltaproteobacteria bacterium]|nr:type II secretion system inner membrane protein GspF [Deltaproteobacteria bacterium]